MFPFTHHNPPQTDFTHLPTQISKSPPPLTPTDRRSDSTLPLGTDSDTATSPTLAASPSLWPNNELSAFLADTPPPQQQPPPVAMPEYQRHGSIAGASQASTASGPPPPSSPARAAPASASAAASQPAQHKRVYQACLPCRRRKVRCDLGSVDNPSDPPCQRCRRESKKCEFSLTRRKRKTEDAVDPDGGYGVVDEYILRNGRKRLHTDEPSPPPPPEHHHPRSYSDTPLRAAAPAATSNVRSRPLPRPEPARSYTNTTTRDSVSSSHHGDFAPNVPEDSNPQVENYEAQTVMRSGVFGTHDALDLLYKAATNPFVYPPSHSLRVISRRGTNSSVSDAGRTPPKQRQDAPTPPRWSPDQRSLNTR